MACQSAINIRQAEARCIFRRGFYRVAAAFINYGNVPTGWLVTSLPAPIGGSRRRIRGGVNVTFKIFLAPSRDHVRRVCLRIISERHAR